MAKIDDDDFGRNTSDNETFEQVVEARLSRRGFLGGTLGTVAVASLSSVGALLQAVPVSAKSKKNGNLPLLGFAGIPVSSLDTVVLPEGYTAEVLIAWGDPVSDGPAFMPNAGNSAANQARQWGTHNGGVIYFPINGSSHGLLVQNNEYTNDVLLFPDGTANWSAAKTQKSLAAHGVSVIEIDKRPAVAAARRVHRRAAGASWAANGSWCGRRSTRVASQGQRRSRSADARPVIRACGPARIQPGSTCSAR